MTIMDSLTGIRECQKRSYALAECGSWRDLSASEAQPLTRRGLDHYDVAELVWCSVVLHSASDMMDLGLELHFFIILLPCSDVLCVVLRVRPSF